MGIKTDWCGRTYLVKVDLTSFIPICPATPRNSRCSVMASLEDNSLRQLKTAGCAQVAAGDGHASLEHRNKGMQKR